MSLAVCLAACLGLADPADPPRWAGVDETVIERFAEQAGRKPSAPYLPVAEGNLGCLFFLLAGAIGGFVAGYAYRGLFPPGQKIAEDHAPRT